MDQLFTGREVVLLGGSFNPVHLGHLEMAKAARRQFGFEKIIFLPNSSTYYKEKNSEITDDMRLDMLRLATAPYDYMDVSDLEILRGGLTHTIDTVREIRSIYRDYMSGNTNNKSTENNMLHDSTPEIPAQKIYFIIGGDSLEWIDKWVEAEELLRNVIFISAVRGDTGREQSLRIINRIYEEHPAAEIHLLDMEDCPISSSEIRKLAAEGVERLPDGMLPEAVKRYIVENELYSNM